jgi:hypothetical protein
MSREVSSEVSIDDQRIREYAYHIWLTEGCPQGQAPRHWAMAAALAEAEAEAMAGIAAPPSARPRPASRARSATTTVKAAANTAPTVKKLRKTGKDDI